MLLACCVCALGSHAMSTNHPKQRVSACVFGLPDVGGQAQLPAGMRASTGKGSVEDSGDCKGGADSQEASAATVAGAMGGGGGGCQGEHFIERGSWEGKGGIMLEALTCCQGAGGNRGPSQRRLRAHVNAYSLRLAWVMYLAHLTFTLPSTTPMQCM